MGRLRRHNKHLPAHMHKKHGSYYFVRLGKWLPLGKDYGAALLKYADEAGSVIWQKPCQRPARHSANCLKLNNTVLAIS